MRKVFVGSGGRVMLAAACAVAVSAGLASAAIPDGGGTFSACVAKDGTLRLIDTAKLGQKGHCTQREKLIAWNAAGAPGAAGPAGPAGPKGDPGAGSPPLASVLGGACSTIFDGSAAASARTVGDLECVVRFDHSLSGCVSTIGPRAGIVGYLSNLVTLGSTAPGELIGQTYSGVDDHEVVIVGRRSDGTSISAAQLPGFKLLVFC